MEARELRVGNLVNFPFTNEIVEVVGINAHESIDFKFNKTIINTISFRKDLNLYCEPIEKIKPIPLTEEWLVNFGFKQCNGWDDLKYWSLPNEYSNNFKFDLVESEDGYELPSGVICKYVHLLQNAYFFHYCNGQELTLNK